MGKQTIGDFIRKIDYLKAKKGNDYDNSEDDPSNQLLDVEHQCDDIIFDELKDAYAAFEEKVCIPGFPERHSAAFWVAYSTVCVLERLTRNFLSDHEEMTSQVSTIMLHALVALVKAGPTTTHTELFEKFLDGNVEEYVKTLSQKDIVPLMAAAKVTFKYIPNDDCNEHYYGQFQTNMLKSFFLMFSTEQYKLIQKDFLDTYVHYHAQLPGLPEDYANQIYYLIREMTSNFEDENPYLNLKDVTIIKKHVRLIGEMVCKEGFRKGTAVDDATERTLKRIMKALLTDGYLEDVFDHLISVIVQLHQNENFRKEGERIYDIYIYQLFRNLESSKTPVAKLYKGCVNLVLSILSQKEMNKHSEKLLDEATDCVIMKVKQPSQEDIQMTLTMVDRMVGSGLKTLIRQGESTLEYLKKNKALDWKKYIDEAKKILDTVGTIPKEDMQDDDNNKLDDTISAYRNFMRTLQEQLKKAKVLPQLQSDLVKFSLNCLTISSPVKAELAEECTEKGLLDFSKEEELRLYVLEKCETMIKSKDVSSDNSDVNAAVSNILKAIVESFEGNGKKVTDRENRLIISIILCAGEGGESVIEHFYQEENEELPNLKLMIWLCVLLPYAKLHHQTATMSCIAPVLPEVIRWAKIALVDDHETMMDVCFGILNWVGLATPTELETSLPEIIDLMLQSRKCQELCMLVKALYPHNPEAVHRKLQDMFDRLDEMKENERQTIMTMFHTVAQDHSEAFTKKQISALLKICKSGNQSLCPLILLVVKSIAEKHPQNLVDFMPQLCNNCVFKPESMNLRSGILVCIGGVNEKLGEQAVDYLMKYIDHPDPSISQIVVGTVSSMTRKHKDYMQRYKQKLESLEQSSAVPQVRDTAHNMILVLEGKSVEDIVDDIEQQKEGIAELDTKVDATIGTVISIGDKVIEHDKDIADLETGLNKIEERVDDVEADMGETKIKVEEIDNKTMVNAPKWSRDLTKLMNPTADNNWRLLASRLGYSNDDIRGWATQHDPCMALLSEWYSTHKTSEASYGVLTALTEMNRTDAVSIVENAMKVAEDVVEDEEFEYPTPPPIFLSYQWGYQNEVKLLKHHLNMAGYECWMDVGQMGGGDKLFAKIDNGIRGAKVVICCVTEKYAQSPNCNREVNLSVNLNKPMIPLLMEKMTWPPKGSMGPIFSEYLFIRFFQRGGEETGDIDQRYWPIPKFQELLMQLNFFVVPDQTMVTKEYDRWWAPIVEDIIIDKNKSKTQNSSQKVHSSETEVMKPEEPPVVFLSYQWGKQPQIKALYQRLTSLGYTVWMDIYQMGGGDSLYDKIDRGMRGCKAVVSCVTQKYSLSANCRREISLADALKKPIIPLLLEQMKWPPDGPMSIMFTELLYINCYKIETVQLKWTGEKFNELTAKLRHYVPEIAKEVHSKTKDSTKGDTRNVTGNDIDTKVGKDVDNEKSNGRRQEPGKADVGSKTAVVTSLPVTSKQNSEKLTSMGQSTNVDTSTEKEHRANDQAQKSNKSPNSKSKSCTLL